MLCGSGDKRSVIEHYFKRGFCCGTIVHFLQEYHEISLNVKTLKRRRLRQFGFDEETIFIRTLYSGNIKSRVKLMAVHPHFLDTVDDVKS